MDISDFVKKAKEYNVLGIKISKDNELAAEWYSEPECRRNIYSATKSFTSCAVGFAVQEGLIDLNEKLTEAFSGDLPECIDENLKEATVRDLLTMCLGHLHLPEDNQRQSNSLHIHIVTLHRIIQNHENT